jgi:hypothetical protein
MLQGTAQLLVYWLTSFGIKAEKHDLSCVASAKQDVPRGFQERAEGLGGGGDGGRFCWFGHVAEFLQYLV